MFSKSLKMIEIDRSTLELQKIVFRRYNINISTFAGFIVWFLIDANTQITLRMWLNTETRPILTGYFTCLYPQSLHKQVLCFTWWSSYSTCVPLHDSHDLYIFFKPIPFNRNLFQFGIIQTTRRFIYIPCILRVYLIKLKYNIFNVKIDEFSLVCYNLSR
jgi:hypothetical protein